MMKTGTCCKLNIPVVVRKISIQRIKIEDEWQCTGDKNRWVHVSTFPLLSLTDCLVVQPCVEKENFSIEEDLINVALGKSLAFDDGLASDWLIYKDWGIWCICKHQTSHSDRKNCMHIILIKINSFSNFINSIKKIEQWKSVKSLFNLIDNPIDFL